MVGNVYEWKYKYWPGGKSSYARRYYYDKNTSRVVGPEVERDR